MDNTLTRSDNERTTLLIPALRSFYDWAADVSWLVIRLTAGLMLLPHGIPKVFEQGISAFAAAGLARRGIEPSMPIAWVYVPKFGWTGPGYEYPLMWGLIAFAIALRGGGPYSVDRKLGWEI